MSNVILPLSFQRSKPLQPSLRGAKRRGNLVCLILLSLIATLFCFKLSFAAENINASTAKENLKQILKSTHSLEGSFTQTTQDDLENILQASKGNFKLSAPGLFLWETTAPYEQKIIVKNNQVLLLDPELLQATVRSLGDSADQLPVLLLTAGGDNNSALKALDNFEITQKHKKEYELVSRDPNSLVSNINLIFASNGPISQIKFTNSLSQITVINFQALKANQEINSEIFNQKIPDDFDVINS